MTITYMQAVKMLTLVAEAVPDPLDCDGCFELLSEFAERELRGEEPTESLKLVEVHLTQCSCCRYEYATLIEAIRAADE